MNWPSDFINKIICGDCFKIMNEMPAGNIDLIQTDPPYNFDSRAGRGFIARTKKQYIKKINESFGHDFQPEQYLETSVKIMKKYNAYWWCSKNLIHRYINWALEHKFFFNVLTWHKQNPVPLWYGNYLPDTEYCIFIREKGAYFNSDLKNWRKYHKFYLTNIGGNKYKNYHPPEKPLWIIKNQIDVSSREKDIILDLFLGTGTTAVAAKELKRNFIGIEINPDYCKIAEERLAQGVL